MELEFKIGLDNDEYFVLFEIGKDFEYFSKWKGRRFLGRSGRRRRFGKIIVYGVGGSILNFGFLSSGVIVFVWGSAVDLRIVLGSGEGLGGREREGFGACVFLRGYFS